jgi:hypothetical protein
MDDIEYLSSLLDFPYPDDVQPVRATLPGPAFFPGGTGVLSGDRAACTLPRGGVMLLGHNFGTVRYFETLQAAGRENLEVPTWRVLLRFLRECDISPEECFFTNVLMGLMRADRIWIKSPVTTMADFGWAAGPSLKLRCADRSRD